MNKYLESLKELKQILCSFGDTDCSRCGVNRFCVYNKFCSMFEEKETPKKPKTEMNEHNAIDELCPICNSTIQKWDNYCYKCGQRIRSDE